MYGIVRQPIFSPTCTLAHAHALHACAMHYPIAGIIILLFFTDVVAAAVRATVQLQRPAAPSHACTRTPRVMLL